MIEQTLTEKEDEEIKGRKTLKEIIDNVVDEYGLQLKLDKVFSNPGKTKQ